MNAHPEFQYLNLLQQVLREGTLQANRTSQKALTIDGGMMQFDLTQGFPLLTTKQVYYTQAFAEMIGFLRGLDNAQDFADLGCKWWFKDANENTQWLASPYRKGENDLGRVYGVNWRKWRGKVLAATPNFTHTEQGGKILAGNIDLVYEEIDQVQLALDAIRAAIKTGIASRRIIINAWRPDEFDQMALPPCHVAYEFVVNVEKGELNMTMWQRSCDMFLGVPMNIATSALLLTLFAQATGLKAKRFTHFLSDVHIYANHIDQVKLQLTRAPLTLPTVRVLSMVNPQDWTANQMAQIRPEDIMVYGYDSHDPIPGEMVTG